MTTSDRLHALAAKLWSRATADGDYSYSPAAIRIDRHGWYLLLKSGDAHKDGSLDRYEHDDKKLWRKLERITTHTPLEAALRDINSVGEAEDIVCAMLCIEARQDGEHGRRKYYDATGDDLEFVRTGWRAE